MPRKNRSTRPEVVYHAISRFVGQEWFVRSSEERRGYLSLFGRAIAASDWRCVAYAIMSNHLHLALVAGATALADWLRPMHTDFAQWINERTQRIGAVFVRGPSLHEVSSDHVARVIGYIHCNPVRARVAAAPRDSDWTSHQHYLGLDARRPWVDVNLGLSLAGFDTGADLDAWICSQPSLLHAPAKRGRGRPRKVLQPEHVQLDAAVGAEAGATLSFT